MEVRLVGDGDEEALQGFLAAHADTSMFLRSNLLRGGLVDRGETWQGTYGVAIEGGAIVGAAASYWQGNVVLCAPRGAAELTSFVARAAGREIAGLLGPWAELEAARGGVAGLRDRPVTMDSREVLYGLAIADLALPPLLAREGVLVRPPRKGDERELELLAGWRVDYLREAIHQPPSDEQLPAAREEMIRLARPGDAFVLEVDGELVSFSAFNARIPDTVQIGGVWTPPALRGRGYARAVVAGSLVAARAQGVTRSILFTGDDHLAARRAYESIGYRAVGDYGIVLYGSS
jgi:RimJ/RimL family protein N-acetyltransferase